MAIAAPEMCCTSRCVIPVLSNQRIPQRFSHSASSLGVSNSSNSGRASFDGPSVLRTSKSGGADLLAEDFIFHLRVLFYRTSTKESNASRRVDAASEANSLYAVMFERITLGLGPGRHSANACSLVLAVAILHWPLWTQEILTNEKCLPTVLPKRGVGCHGEL